MNAQPSIDDLKRLLLSRLEQECQSIIERDEPDEPDHEFDETDLALGKD